MIPFQTPLGTRWLPDDADIEHERAKIMMEMMDRYSEDQLTAMNAQMDIRARDQIRPGELGEAVKRGFMTALAGGALKRAAR